MNYNINKSNNQVPKGYKKTKVGVIPEDWEVVKLGSVCEKNAKYGINAPAVEFDKNLPVYLRITDIDEKGNFNPNKISSVKDDEYKKFILQENELVLARTGATVGKSYLYNKKDGELVYAGFLIKISPDLTKLNSVFLKNYLNTSLYWHWVKIMSVRSGQPGINAEEYSILPIPLPPLKEQKKIANILTTWDDAISQQDELIKAKEELKKGLMQKLLSGEVRFEGFSEEWEEIRLSGIFNITRGNVIAKKELSTIMKDDYIYPVYSSQTKDNGILGYHNTFDFEGNFITWTTDGANAGKTTYRNGKFKCTNVCGVLYSKENNLGTANKCIAEMIDKVSKKYVSYVGNPKLMNNVMGQVKIKLPPLQEQQKIAQVLTNADKEIDLLKNELEVLKEQKKGLMQKLLSGEVRVKI